MLRHYYGSQSDIYLQSQISNEEVLKSVPKLHIINGEREETMEGFRTRLCCYTRENPWDGKPWGRKSGQRSYNPATSGFGAVLAFRVFQELFILLVCLIQGLSGTEIEDPFFLPRI